MGGRWTLRIANPASGASVKATCMLERAGLGEGGGGAGILDTLLSGVGVVGQLDHWRVRAQFELGRERHGVLVVSSRLADAREHAHEPAVSLRVPS